MEKYPFLNEVVGKILQEHRTQAGLSKRQLSVLAGIERAYITGLERGQWNVTFNALMHLCEALEMNPLEFMKEVIGELEKAHGGMKWPYL